MTAKRRCPPGMTSISIGALLLSIGVIMLILLGSGLMGNSAILPPVITPLRIAAGCTILGAVFLGAGIYVRKNLITLYNTIVSLEKERAKLKEKLKEEEMEAKEAKELIKNVSEKVREISQRLRKKR